MLGYPVRVCSLFSDFLSAFLGSPLLAEARAFSPQLVVLSN